MNSITVIATIIGLLSILRIVSIIIWTFQNYEELEKYLMIDYNPVIEALIIPLILTIASYCWLVIFYH